MRLKVIVAVIFLVSKNAYSAECMWACWAKQVRQEPRQELRPLPLEAINHDELILGWLRVSSRKLKESDQKKEGLKIHLQTLVKHLRNDKYYEEFVKDFYSGVVCEYDKESQENMLQLCLPFPKYLVNLVGDYMQAWEKGAFGMVVTNGDVIDHIAVLSGFYRRHIFASRASRHVHEEISSLRFMEQEQLREIFLLGAYNNNKRPKEPHRQKYEDDGLEELAERHGISKKAIELVKKRELIMVPMKEIE